MYLDNCIEDAYLYTKDQGIKAKTSHLLIDLDHLPTEKGSNVR